MEGFVGVIKEIALSLVQVGQLPGDALEAPGRLIGKKKGIHCGSSANLLPKGKEFSKVEKDFWGRPKVREYKVTGYRYDTVEGGFEAKVKRTR